MNIIKTYNIGKNVYIGDFTLVREHSIIGNNVKIGSHCIIHPYAEIGDNTNIQSHCSISEHSKIGKNCFIAPFFNAPADNSIGKPKGKYKPNPAIIKDNVRIGSHVCLKPSIVVGRGAIIGMGSVVTKNVPPRETWVGNPAKRLK